MDHGCRFRYPLIVIAKVRRMLAAQAHYRAVVFDLDGTLYLSGRPIDGAQAAVAAVRAAGLSTLFVSNNPLRTPYEYAERLSAIGIPASEDEVITSSTVVTAWLNETLPQAQVFVVGEPHFHDQMRQAGVRLTSAWRNADVVLVSFDRTFEYQRWRDANFALRAGARFVATNPDVTCPTADGEIPDCGGIIAALEASSRRRVEVVAGKPSRTMAQRIGTELALPPSDILVVGDRLATDMALAHTAGFGSALVLSGVTSRDDAQAADERTTYLLDSVADLPRALALPGELPPL